MVMKKEGIVWKIYRLLFLDIWHRRFFNLPVNPEHVDFTKRQKDTYLSLLNLQIKVVNYLNQPVVSLPKTPTLYYGNHPSSLDALFTYFVLLEKRPWFVSYLHNMLHFKFLSSRTIPVGARFVSKNLTPLGLKMKLASRLENMSDDECRVMNRLVPNLVAKKLLAGEDVVIFPSGGWGNWQDGIGFALNEVYQKNPDFDLRLQPIKIISFREIHSVIHGWLHIFAIKIPGTIKVKFGKTKKLSDLNGQVFMRNEETKNKAKGIRKWLEDDYHSW
jgi:hypothetical protein